MSKQTQNKVDATKFLEKIEAIIANLNAGIPEMVADVSTELVNAVDKNINGVEYVPGELPVRRITGTLARAYMVKDISPVLHYHYFDDEDVANYAKFVHDGTKFMLPRPFFHEAVNSVRPYMRKKVQEIAREIRRRGRK